MWTTEMELEYLNTIGESMMRPLPKSLLLVGYISSIRGRVDWGNMDKEKISSHASKLYGEVP